MANKTTFNLELGAMDARIEDLNQKLRLGISAAFDEVGLFSTAWMKTNAPWTDRTGAARAGLHSDTSHAGNRWELVLAHAVAYGIWLEVAHSGRYQIIMPAVQVATNRLQSHFRGMMGDLR